MAALNGTSGSSLFKMLCQSVEQDKDKIMTDAAFRKEIETSFMEIADLLQVRLFKVDTPFWGIALMGVVKEIDWKQRGFIDLKIGRPIRMSFNPMFIENLKNDSGEHDIRIFIGFMVSELMRLIYLHPETFGSNNRFNDKVSHSKLERASDTNVSELMKSSANAQINNIKASATVDASGKIKPGSDSMKIVLPDTIMTQDKLAKMTGKNLDKEATIEYYYHAQKDMKEPPAENGGGGGQSGDGEGDTNGIATPDNNNGHGVHNWESTPGGADEATAIIKDFLQELSEKTRGLAPSGVGADIEKLLRAPERSYKDLFADMVQASEVTDYEPTRMRLNRRFPDRLDLFGKKPIGHHHVYVAVDTSGSTMDVVKDFIVEMMGICREANSTVTIIECDAQIQKVYDLDRPEDFQYKMKGWGGTCFSPVIDFVNGEPEFMKKCPAEFKQYWRDPEESVLCFFTDGYGEREIPKPKVQKLLWVVSRGAKNLSVENPHGKVVGILEGKR